jgi:protein TonB
VRRNRTFFRRALEASLLLHLLLLFVVLPRVHDVWPAALAASPLLAARPPDRAQPPLEFEFVDLPEEREEPPSSDRVPLSDLDRRAHGGEGQEASDRPASRGNTPQIVRSEGGTVLDRGAPPSRVGPPSEAVSPSEQAPERERAQPEPDVPRPAPEGAGEHEPRPPQPEPALRLPPAGAWTLPPAAGGLPENPDRNGGAVDEGGLSFDTQWYDWGPYAKKMLRKIRMNWQIPEIARLGVDGVVKIRFFIERNGAVTGLQILDESGKPPMDFAARDAIGDSSPFDPLPGDLTGVEREGITITFYYNTRPPERGGR